MLDILRNDGFVLKNVRFREVCIYNTEWNYARPCYHWKQRRQGIAPYRPGNRKFKDCAYNVMCKDVSGWNRWGEHTAKYCQNCKFYGGLVFGGQVKCLYKKPEPCSIPSAIGLGDKPGKLLVRKEFDKPIKVCKGQEISVTYTLTITG